MFLEMDNVANAEPAPLAGVVQKVAQVGECRSDLAIINDLGRRLGLGQHFWASEQEALDLLVAPAGLTFDQFREVGTLAGHKDYGGYLASGFPTASGKVELYSQQLEEWGFDPLPVYREPPESPFSAPESVDEFPLVLTNSKIPGYVHSGGRQIPSLRRLHPDPLVTINRETAAAHGIAAGDWVSISTKRGTVRQRAVLSPDVDPRVVIAEHGWYFPGAAGRYGGLGHGQPQRPDDERSPLRAGAGHHDPAGHGLPHRQGERVDGVVGELLGGREGRLGAATV